MKSLFVKKNYKGGGTGTNMFAPPNNFGGQEEPPIEYSQHLVHLTAFNNDPENINLYPNSGVRIRAAEQAWNEGNIWKIQEQNAYSKFISDYRDKHIHEHESERDVLIEAHKAWEASNPRNEDNMDESGEENDNMDERDEENDNMDERDEENDNMDESDEENDNMDESDDTNQFKLPEESDYKHFDINDVIPSESKKTYGFESSFKFTSISNRLCPKCNNIDSADDILNFGTSILFDIHEDGTIICKDCDAKFPIKWNSPLYLFLDFDDTTSSLTFYEKIEKDNGNVLERMGGNYIEVIKTTRAKGYEINYDLNEKIFAYGLNKKMLKSLFDLVFQFVKRYETHKKFFESVTNIYLVEHLDSFYKYFDQFNDKHDDSFQDMFKNRFSKYQFPKQNGNKICPEDKLENDMKLLAIYDYHKSERSFPMCRETTSNLKKRYDDNSKRTIINELNETNTWFAYAYFMYKFLETEYGFRQNDARDIFNIKMHSFYPNVMKKVDYSIDKYFVPKNLNINIDEWGFEDINPIKPDFTNIPASDVQKAEILDVIEYETYNVIDWLNTKSEAEDRIVFLHYDKDKFAKAIGYDRKRLLKQIDKKKFFYLCMQEDLKGIGLSVLSRIDITRPYMKISGEVVYYVDAQVLLGALKSPHNIFVLKSGGNELEFTASAKSILRRMREGAVYESTDHCQKGSNKSTFNLTIANVQKPSLFQQLSEKYNQEEYQQLTPRFQKRFQQNKAEKRNRDDEEDVNELRNAIEMDKMEIDYDEPDEENLTRKKHKDSESDGDKMEGGSRKTRKWLCKNCSKH